jgi:hypothetical protein
MNEKLAIALMTGFLVFGIIQAGVPQTDFESTKRKALDLYTSLVSLAAPQVRVKISASALAFKNYLAQCSRKCNVYQFCFNDLKARFTSLTDNEVYLLMALVFAEAVSGMSPQMQLKLSDPASWEENRQFTMISTILKSKNDILKATIKNIR